MEKHKRPRSHRSVYLSDEEMTLIRRASRKIGSTLTGFLRLSSIEKARQVLIDFEKEV